MGVIRRTHNLVQLLSRSDTDESVRQIRCHRTGQVDDPDGWNLRHEDLPAVHAREVLEHEIHTLLHRNPKSRHGGIGDWQKIAAALDLLAKERHNRSTRTDYIAVPHNRKPGSVPARHIIGGDE